MIALKFDKCYNKVIYKEFKKFSVMRWLIFWVNLKDKQYLSSKGEAVVLWIDVPAQASSGTCQVQWGFWHAGDTKLGGG